MPTEENLLCAQGLVLQGGWGGVEVGFGAKTPNTEPLQPPHFTIQLRNGEPTPKQRSTCEQTFDKCPSAQRT